MKPCLYPWIFVLACTVAFAGDCLSIGLQGNGPMELVDSSAPQWLEGTASGNVTLVLDGETYPMRVTWTPMGATSTFHLPGTWPESGPVSYRGAMWVLRFSSDSGTLTLHGSGEKRQDPEDSEHFEMLQSVDATHGTGIFTGATGRLFIRIQMDIGPSSETGPDLLINQISGVLCNLNTGTPQFKR